MGAGHVRKVPARHSGEQNLLAPSAVTHEPCRVPRSQTILPDDAKGRTGFEVRMGKQKVHLEDCQLHRGHRGVDSVVLVCAQPVPIKLQLEPRDLVKYNISQVNFTPAQFNTGDSINEEWIVTRYCASPLLCPPSLALMLMWLCWLCNDALARSTGKYVITWNFRKIKQNNIKNHYKVLAALPSASSA